MVMSIESMQWIARKVNQVWNTGTRSYAAPHGPHTCSGCPAVWTGSRAAHATCCHRTFASVSLFDAHRSIVGSHGTCKDPAALTFQSGPRAGARVMFYRDGIWRSPEMTDEQKAEAFGSRSS
jgi:hypothetical protein